MSGTELIHTAVLLGVFILLGGLYGVFYGMARLHASPRLFAAGYGAYALQVIVTIGIVAATPLAPVWKVFLVASCLAYCAIPPITWRYLRSLHDTSEAAHDSQPGKHSPGFVAGLRDSP